LRTLIIPEAIQDCCSVRDNQQEKNLRNIIEPSGALNEICHKCGAEIGTKRSAAPVFNPQRLIEAVPVDLWKFKSEF
jgi:hypothetical protein